MRAYRQFVVSTSSLVFLALLPGCIAVAVAAGAAGVAYVNGDLEATLDASPERVIQASEAALKDMNVPIKSKESSGIDGKLVGRTALEKKVEITVQRETDTTSKISIRIDTFGDESLSRQILEKIKSKL
jgi:uncharacterized protein DUF3568